MISMNNTIKQLQNEKKRKIRSMEMKEVKRYIERNVAYYYSHYVNFEDVYNSSDVIVDENKNDAMMFQKSFNENIDLILESIQESYSEPSVKQMRLNYVLAVLFQSINENLMLNHEKETKLLKKMFDDIQESIVLQNSITGLIVGFVSFVNTTYSLLDHVKSMLLSLYQLVSIYDVDDMMFNSLNMSFKALFIDFHMNYVCCKKNNIQDILDVMSNGKFSVDDIVESKETLILYHDAVDKLSEIDNDFLLLVKDDDLFSFPKMYLKKFSIDESVVYDLKQFDIDYVIESDDIVDGLFDDDVVSDEYKQMELLEKKYNVSLLFEVGASDDAMTGASVTGAIAVDDADINDMNIDELEEMLL